MSKTEAIAVRADADIHKDISNMMAHYPPLAHDSHRIEVSVKDGAVTVTGHAKGRFTRRYLLDKLPTMDGVKSVKADKLYDDETIRLDTGRIVPWGVQVRLEYGAVILSGRLPGDVKEADLVKRVGKIPGVCQVVTAFTGS